MKLGMPAVAPQRSMDSAATPTRRDPVVDWNRVSPEVRQAAEGMETMFLDYLMQTMRKSVPKSDMSLRNQASEIYQSMLDSEYAQRAARAGGVGLAEQIVAYLERPRYTEEVVSRGTGGTHEDSAQ